MVAAAVACGNAARRAADEDAGHEPDLDAGEQEWALDVQDVQDGLDAIIDEPSDPPSEWTSFDGVLPDLPPAEKADHLACCMRTRACSSSPQQLGTCAASYAHIQGRMMGIVLGSVARCVVAAEPDCTAIVGCLTDGEGPTPCEPLVTPDRCDGTVLRQCSRASAVDLVVDCAHLGLDCFIDSEGTATCGLGTCDPASFRPDCFGDTLVVCERGVIVVAQCDRAGLACEQAPGAPGSCTGGGASCSESTDPRRCDGDLILGCIGGSTASVDCNLVVEDWTCGPRDGTFGCVPSGDECTADPLFGTDVDESCGTDSVIFCLDGWISPLSCSELGMGPCTDLGMAARCTPP